MSGVELKGRGNWLDRAAERAAGQAGDHWCPACAERERLDELSRLAVRRATVRPQLDLRRATRELVEEVTAGGLVALTRYGRRIAVIVPAEWLDDALSAVEVTP